MSFPVRQCAYCGQDFTPDRYNQIYCKRPHTMVCPACGESYVVTDHRKLSKPATACSYRCRAALTAKTSLQRYGCKAPGNNRVARQKARQTSVERYGTLYPMQNETVQSRQIASLRQHHGVSNPGQLKSILKNSGSIVVSESKCILLVLHREYADKFLNQYDHLHKTSRHHELCLGYFYQEDLIQVMTFGRSQFEGYRYQLFRACISDYEVTDGFSIMLDTAINKFELDEICYVTSDLNVSIDDILLSRGCFKYDEPL